MPPFTAPRITAELSWSSNLFANLLQTLGVEKGALEKTIVPFSFESQICLSNSKENRQENRQR